MWASSALRRANSNKACCSCGRRLLSYQYSDHLINASRRLLKLPEKGGLNQAQVRAAYLKQAKIWHPDRNQATGSAADATQRFQAIHRAYEVSWTPVLPS